jgi:hypothetical protein
MRLLSLGRSNIDDPHGKVHLLSGREESYLIGETESARKEAQDQSHLTQAQFFDGRPIN